MGQEKLMLVCSLAGMILLGPLGCVSAPESDSTNTQNETATAELRKQLELRCPDNGYVSIQRGDTHEVLEFPSCTAVRKAALAHEETREKLLAAMKAVPKYEEESPAPGIGEAKEPGIIGFFLGLAVTGYMNYKCEKEKMRWQECTAASVPLLVLLYVFPW